MGIEEIISRIKQEAHRQADSEIAEARRKANTLRREFERELEKKREALERELEARTQARVGMVLSEARREARDMVLLVKESIIRECIDSAITSLRSLPREEYRNLLLNLAIKGKEQVGENCFVSVTRKEDIELLIGVPGVELTSEIVSGSGGVVVYSQDRKLRVDNTIEGILQRKRGEIRSLAARMLFS